MVNIPLLNRDSEWLRQWIDQKASQPEMQKRLVLVVVSIALLLDNMLYMVIVPIIPKYLRDIHAYEVEYVGYHNETRRLANGTIVVRMIGGQIDYLDEEIELGWLFASKALLQIFVNPFSGFIIDRVGYELPMIIGLIVMFSSTAIFALGRSYGVLFFARSLQGFGSAFADTSGLAMIADRFQEESERSAALGIALAFISFGCLVAPPFGSVLYSLAGKPVPFLILSLVCLLDAFMVFWVIQPKARGANARNPETGERLQGTPMWQLFMDPFIAVCSGALIMANISLAFLEPTITTWMAETMPETPAWQVGMIWFPAFFPHVLGVYVTVRLLKRYPQQSWLFAAVGLSMEGLSCLAVPFMSSALQLVIPLSTICFGIALIDTSLLPMLGFLVDTRHVSVYGSVYAIADISYSLAYAFGPIIAGGIVNSMGFLTLNLLICVLNIGYTPLIGMLRKVYGYEQVQGTVQPTVSDGTADGQQMKNGGPERPPPPGRPTRQEQHPLENSWGDAARDAQWGMPGGYQQTSDFGGSGATNPFGPVQGGTGGGGFDPLNPQWHNSPVPNPISNKQQRPMDVNNLSSGGAEDQPNLEKLPNGVDGLLETGMDGWYQQPLPKPPLPSLAHTLDRYLEYASVLADTYGMDLQRTVKSIADFMTGQGPKLQKKLAELADAEENWVNGFWLPEMYLRIRLPLPVNSNPAYIFPRKSFCSEQDQIDYAAWLVRGFLDFKERVNKKQIPLETVPDRFSQGQTVRMCMDQYERILNCYREPGHGEDVMHDRRIKGKQFLQNGGPKTLTAAEEHILVMCECQAFVLFTRWEGNPLPATQIAMQLAKIRQKARNRSALGAITMGGAGTGNRDKAAQFWVEMGKEPTNQRSLDWVRSSVFVLCLDNDSTAPSIIDEKQELTVQERDGLQILHGFGSVANGLNRWFDATIQLIVAPSGCCGMCIEHSVAEGIVYINMTEEVIRFANKNWSVQRNCCADSSSLAQQVDGDLPSGIPEPSPLCWVLTGKAFALLAEQIAEFDRSVHDLQLRVLHFTGFGKNAIKGWHVSPDGFVQLCMQLAHFKLHGYLVSTYESATMRRFRFGRVDNIRAATPEALEWVKAMCNPAMETMDAKRRLFIAAASKQALITRENVTGHGIDNHLCALEVLSRQQIVNDGADGDDGKRPELFAEPMWKEMMRFPLTTSQVSTSSSPDFHDCYLCYGPVVRDGYGCAYNIQPERIIFAISSQKSDTRTNVEAFREKLNESLNDMQQMLESN